MQTVSPGMKGDMYMAARFIQVHTLTSYPASLLNRDDAGFAKRMPFGGAVRTRVSSQCLKRHWRVYEGEWGFGTLDVGESVRSREVFSRLVLPKVQAAVVDEVRARWSVAAMVALLQVGTASGKKASDKRQAVAAKFVGQDGREQARPAKRRRAPEDEEESESTPGSDALRQIVVLGPNEVDYLASEAIALAGDSENSNEDLIEVARQRASREQQKNLDALKKSVTKGAGLSAALFGRMRTGDLFADVDAAIHVAHAMTVHAQMAESDYFTAIDDLIHDEGEQASGHINSSELTCGVFYGYVVVDVNGLVANLGEDRSLAGDIVQRLVHILSTVTPGAKKGSTAPYAYSHLVLIESGSAQPRTLQNAFLDPVSTKGNVIEHAYDALQLHLSDLDEMYGKRESRAHAGLRTNGRFENRKPIDELAAWASSQVIG